jgi:hypothetical protein
LCGDRLTPMKQMIVCEYRSVCFFVLGKTI